MGFLSYITRLFESVPEQIEETEEKLKNYTLLVLTEHFYQDGEDATSFQSIYHSLQQKGWQLPRETLTEAIAALVKAGRIQRLDGGNKELQATEVSYMISDNGLNSIGLPSR